MGDTSSNGGFPIATVDGQNPAPVEVGSLSTMIDKVLVPYQAVVGDFETINSYVRFTGVYIHFR